MTHDEMVKRDLHPCATPRQNPDSMQDRLKLGLWMVLGLGSGLGSSSGVGEDMR